MSLSIHSIKLGVGCALKNPWSRAFGTNKPQHRRCRFPAKLYLLAAKHRIAKSGQNVPRS